MDMKNLYAQIAKMHGVTPEEVERDMQSAINMAYNNSTKTKEQDSIQNQVPRSSDVPSNEEMIDFIVKELKK